MHDELFGSRRNQRKEELKKKRIAFRLEARRRRKISSGFFRKEVRSRTGCLQKGKRQDFLLLERRRGRSPSRRILVRKRA